MKPTPTLLTMMADLLAADPAGLGDLADNCHVHLAKAAFNPAAVLVPADLTEADFTGSAAKLAGLGPQQSFVDATSLLRVVQMLEPAGGWHWVATDLVNLPQTIYGYYLTDEADAILYGSELLEAPIAITAADQAVDIASVRFRMLNNALS